MLIRSIRVLNSIPKRVFCQHQPQNSRMAGIPLPEILKELQAFAPLSLAESWDNVGLLIDSMNTSPVRQILLTNDLTEDVLAEAIQLNANLIVSYHPNIFQGLKTVTSKTWKERLVVQCIKNNISVYSPHTSWDSVEGGVNDWLAGAFPSQQVKAIVAKDELGRIGAGRILKLEPSLTLAQIIELIKKHIGIPHLRLALARNGDINAKIETVALCAGSGHSVLSGVDANLYLTGEMLHHDILDATQKGINVILCNHSDSERGFLKVFRDKLEKDVLQGAVRVAVSESDRDPLQTV